MMMKSFLATALAIVGSCQAAAGVHPIEIEQRLAFIVNDWTLAGAPATYRDDCSWFDNRSFVVCDTRDSRKGSAHRSIAVLGWSAAAGNYTYQQYDDSGRSRTEACFANDEGGLTCLGERRGSDGLTQTRTYIGPAHGGLALRQVKSINAGPWIEVGRVSYIPRKRP